MNSHLTEVTKSKFCIESLFGVLVVAVAILAGIQPAASQTSTNKTEFTPDKTLKSSARVNPTSLAMEFSIPLPSYPGRAGAALPNSINYSSKVWGTSVPAIYSNTQGSHQSITAQFSKGAWAGWTSTLGVPQIDTTVEAYTEYGYSWTYDLDLEEGSDFNIVYVKKMRIIMPDGSSHEMRADDGYHPYGTAVWPGSGVTDADFYSGTFLSVDGSRMRLEFASSTFASSVLYMPDGSRFVGLPAWNTAVVSGTTTYYDVHGNKMLYTVSTSPSTTATWTDTMGRILPDPLPRAGLSVQPTATGTQTATYPTLPGGTAQSIQYTWANLSTQQSTLSYVSQSICSGGTTTPIPGGSPYLFASSGTNPRVCPGQSGTFNPIVLTALTLPNGAKYSFHYNIYGEIDRIDYPTGGYERFVYAQADPIAAVGIPAYDQFNRIVTDRYISEDGSTEVRWQYATQKSGGYRVKTYAPDGSWSEQFFDDSPNLTIMGTYGYNTMPPARNYETRVYKDTSTNTLLRRTLSSTTKTGPLTIGGMSGVSYAYRDIRSDKEVSMIFEPDSGSTSALVTMTEHSYDTTGNSDPAYFSSLNEEQTKTHNYVVQSASTAAGATMATASSWFSGSTVSAISETDFLYDSNYQARNLNSLPTETRIKDSSNATKAKTQYSYDESSYVCNLSTPDTFCSGPTMPSGATGSWIDPKDSGQLGATIGAKRGLPTSVKRYHDIANSYYIETHNFFDQYGNPTKVRDGRGNNSTTAYDDDYAFAYPTSGQTAVPDSTGAQGSSSALTASTTYDYDTGLTITATDTNALVTEFEYVDALLRPTKVTPKYSGSPVGARTEMEYGAPSSGIYSSSQRFVKTKTQIDSTYWKESYGWADGLGRAFRSQEIKSGDDVYAVTCFDNMGRVQKASNPVSASSAPTCSSSLEWTTPAYDKLGRTVSTTTPDSAVAYIAYGLSTSTPIGTTVTATDQAGKKRKSVTDAPGDLKRVVEDPDTLAYATDYTYNVLKNLTNASQGSQSRTFAYDALSRLTSANNPESGSVTYTYDANSNLATKADARSITTTYSYDLLNRAKQRSYSDGTTPTVTYYYDNVTNAKGKLIKVSNSNSITEYTGFDNLGRVTAHKQTTGGTAYTTAYSYYLGGALYEETYPSGRVVRSSLSTDGYMSQVETKPSGGSFTNRASNFTYTAAGAVSAMQLGNSLWESTTFNNRLQPTAIKLGTTSGGTDRLSLAYTYGTTNNNGNVLTQTIAVPSGFTATQTYTYDALNRIGSASESIGSPTWSQTYGYDQYGNRNITAGTGQTSLTFSGNRITSSGYSYDNAGNTLDDPSGKTFVYDAENKQTSVSNGGTLGNYSYDGDGKRVKKYNTSTTDNVIFVYDAAGKLIEEYNLTPTLQTSYIYAGSRLLSTETSGPTTNYLTADHLASPRINTNGGGSVTARHDYMPFGEEVFSSLTPQRSSGVGYSGDSVRKQFTEYEGDGETGLYFAQARYQSDSIGRFLSPDPVMISEERLQHPQMMNLYVYCANNPLVYVDPDGEEIVKLGQHTNAEIATRLAEIQQALAAGDGETGKESRSERAELEREDATLRAEREGNNVVGAWLDALNTTGQNPGVSLSDLSLSTDPVNDLGGAARIAGESAAAVADIVSSADGSTLVATVIGGQIYVLPTSDVYQATRIGGVPSTAVGTIARNDVARFGGSWLSHEDYHQRNGRSEYDAYSHQARVLDNMNKSKSPFQNQKFLAQLKQEIQVKIQSEKKREGR